MTATRFILTITLGNDAMQSGDDVQRALALTGAEIANRYDGLTLPVIDPRPIHDANGNKVGTWQATDTSADDIAATVLDNHAIQSHWNRSGEQVAQLLAEAVRIARGEN